MPKDVHANDGAGAAAIARVVDGPALLFERSALERLADRLRDEYAAAQPFPHVVLDGFLPADAAARVVEEFPPISDFAWDGPEGGNKIGKFNSTSRTEIGPFTRGLLAQLCCSPFIDFLERMTGTSGLLPDPRQIDRALRHFLPGGRLAIHADFNSSKALGLERRINLILYLNRHWPPEYGGALEFWEPDMSARVKSIAPIFNRAVLFDPATDGYHGFPDPVRCAEGDSRKSLQLYYYAAPRSDLFRQGTTWRVHPDDSLLSRVRRRLFASRVKA